MEVIEVLTLCGSGRREHKDGIGRIASFNWPQGICFDSTTNTYYVCDTYNHCIRAIQNQTVTTVFGNPGKEGNKEGRRLSAEFNYPQGICVGENDKLFVCDW